MASNSQVTCDPDRIEAFLQQQLNAEEQSDFETHLDECPSCRDRLESSAAGDDIWTEVRESLSAEPLSVELSDPATGDQTAFSHQTVLDWLAPTDDDRMLGRLGTYEIAGVVGSGGMGVVLKAFDPALNRSVAIKVLAPHLATSGAARRRFSREAQASAAVVHENVIEIHGVADKDDLPYLVMPYVSGPSLQRRLNDEGPLELAEILRIGMQAAKGLAAAHSQGLVHRDVKPANILLEQGIERVKLTDFGLARAADDASLTKSGVIAGTPQYMSPEQARGESVDQRSDLFSLGSVLYAMCTGRSPFRAETSYGVLRRITDDEPKPIREIHPEIPDWLCRIIGKLMSKHPDDRFQSAQEVAGLLEACLAHVQQPTIVPLPESLLTCPKTKRFFGIKTAIAALGIGLLAFLAWQATAPPDISGQWTGDGWGQVTLERIGRGKYSGTYTDTFGPDKGRIDLKWSKVDQRYRGTWGEKQRRSGKLSVELKELKIRGFWTASNKSEINPGSPDVEELVWMRGKHESSSRRSPRNDNPRSLEDASKHLDGLWQVVESEKGTSADFTGKRKLLSPKGIDFLEFRASAPMPNVSTIRIEECMSDMLQIEINPRSDPPSIDVVWFHKAFGEQGQVLQDESELISIGIYETTEDELKILLVPYNPAVTSNQRPQSFSLKDHPNGAFYRLKRYVTPPERQALEGSWRVISATEGESNLSDELRGYLLNFSAVGFTTQSAPNSAGRTWGYYQLNTGSNPAEITFITHDYGLWKGPLGRERSGVYENKPDWNGIYRLETEPGSDPTESSKPSRLWIALRSGGDRPESFVLGLKEGVTLLELERQPDASEETTPSEQQSDSKTNLETGTERFKRLIEQRDYQGASAFALKQQALAPDKETRQTWEVWSKFARQLEQTQANSAEEQELRELLGFPPFKIEEPDKPHVVSPPTDVEILRALESRKQLAPGSLTDLLKQHPDDIRFVLEPVYDKLDPPRYFPLIGTARLHSVQYKCIVYFTDTNEVNWPIPHEESEAFSETFKIDQDHLHIVENEVGYSGDSPADAPVPIADTTLQVLGPNGRPVADNAVIRGSEGYTGRKLPSQSETPSNHGVISLSQLKPGTHWLLVNWSSILRLELPAAEQKIVRTPPLPGHLRSRLVGKNLDVQSSVEGTEDDEIIVIQIHNRDKEAVQISETDLQLMPSIKGEGYDARVFSPRWKSVAEGKTLPVTTIEPDGKATLRINWTDWVRHGFWFSRDSEILTEPAPPGNEPGKTWVRVVPGSGRSISVTHPDLLVAGDGKGVTNPGMNPSNSNPREIEDPPSIPFDPGGSTAEVLTATEAVKHGMDLLNKRQKITVRCQVDVVRRRQFTDEYGNKDHDHWELLLTETTKLSVIVTPQAERALQQRKIDDIPEYFTGNMIEIEGTLDGPGREAPIPASGIWTYHFNLESPDQVRVIDPDRPRQVTPPVDNTLQFSQPREIDLSWLLRLDLDTGKTMELSSKKQVGLNEMDVCPANRKLDEPPIGLNGFSLQGLKVKPSDWKATTGYLQQRLAWDGQQPLDLMHFDPDEPATYFFRTQRGTMGVLQILYQTHADPAGIRVRFKTLESLYPAGKLNPEQPLAPEVTPPDQTSDSGNITIQGVVFDTDQQPVPGADVRLTQPLSFTEKLLAKGRTDETGRFRFPGIPRDIKRKLVVSAPSYASMSGDANYYKTSEDVYECVLHEAESLRGRVLDPKGVPVAGAEVYSPLLQEFIAGVLSTRTDRNGFFEIPDMRAWEATVKEGDVVDEGSSGVTDRLLRVYHPDYGIQLVPYSKVPSILTIQFEKPKIITGRVMYEETYKRASGVRVVVGNVVVSTSHKGEYRAALQAQHLKDRAEIRVVDEDDRTLFKAGTVDLAKDDEFDLSDIELPPTPTVESEAKSVVTRQGVLTPDELIAKGEILADSHTTITVRFQIGDVRLFEIKGPEGITRKYWELLPAGETGFSVRFSPEAQAGLTQRGIDDIAGQFRKKIIEVSGTIYEDYSFKQDRHIFRMDLDSLDQYYFAIAPNPVTDSSRHPVSTAIPVARYQTTANVSRISVSPDGKRMAVANGHLTFELPPDPLREYQENYRPVVEIMDTETGKNAVSLQILTDEEAELVNRKPTATSGNIFTIQTDYYNVTITALEFSPDGKLLAVGTRIGQVKLFEAQTGELVRTLNEAQGRLKDDEYPEHWKQLERVNKVVHSLSFSPDGQSLAVSGNAFGDALHTISHSLYFGGPQKAPVPQPGQLTVWNVATGERQQDLIGHHYLNDAEFSPDGKWLASTGSWYEQTSQKSGTILWDAQTGDILHKFSIHESGTDSLEFTPDSKYIALRAHHNHPGFNVTTGVRYLINAETGLMEWRALEPTHASLIGFDPGNSSVLIYRYYDRNELMFFDTATWSVVREYEWNRPPVSFHRLTVALKPDLGSIILGGMGGELNGTVQVRKLPAAEDKN